MNPNPRQQDKTLDATEPATLYRFFSAEGVLLYIGITGDPGVRWSQHAKGKEWWPKVATVTLEHFDDRAAAAAAEVEAIKRELPAWNIAHTPKANAPRGQRVALPLDADPGEPCVSMREARMLLAPLGLSEYTVRNWADAGRLRSFRLGADGKSGHRKIALSSVLAELEKVGATPPSVPGVKLPPPSPPAGE